MCGPLDVELADKKDDEDVDVTSVVRCDLAALVWYRLAEALELPSRSWCLPKNPLS